MVGYVTLGGSDSLGNRDENALCANQSSRGGRPSTRIQRANRTGGTSPEVKVHPPITMFRPLCRLSATYALSSSRAYARGPVRFIGGMGAKFAWYDDSPQIIQCRTEG